MPLYSLPSRCGKGHLGDAARDFLRFLSKAGQSYWQVGHPYAFEKEGALLSLFGGSFLLIDDYKLWEEGLIKEEDKLVSLNNSGQDKNAQTIKEEKSEEKPNKGKQIKSGLTQQEEFIIKRKKEIIKKAYYNFFAQPNITEFYSFCEKNKSWLDGYALFMTLKEENGFAPWYLWEKCLAEREKGQIEKALQKYEEKIEFYRFEQYLFSKQWKDFLADADKRGVKIIGETPLYCPLDSADAWINQELLDLRFLKEGIKRKKPLENYYAVFDCKKEKTVDYYRALFARSGELFDLTYLTYNFDGNEKLSTAGKRGFSAKDTKGGNGFFVKTPKNFLSAIFEGNGEQRFLLDKSCQDGILSDNPNIFCAKSITEKIEKKNAKNGKTAKFFPNERIFLYITDLRQISNESEKNKNAVPNSAVLPKEQKTLMDKLWTREEGKVIISMQTLLAFFEEKEKGEAGVLLSAKTLSNENALKLQKLTRENDEINDAG